jgi:hypothetical protein
MMDVDEDMDHLDAGSTSARSDARSEARSYVSRGSKKSSSTLSSLLSNKSLELVFGLIDDYYQHTYPTQTASTADLLGNFAPNTSATQLETLAAVAVQEHRNESDLVAKVMATAKKDGMQLEELRYVLTAAQEHAALPTANIADEGANRIQQELAEVESLLRELQSIQARDPARVL